MQTANFEGEKYDGTFEVFKDSRGEWRFRLRAANHRTILQSESYGTKQKAFRGAQTVQRVCAGATLIVWAD